jgi:hypothetical protein
MDQTILFILGAGAVSVAVSGIGTALIGIGHIANEEHTAVEKMEHKKAKGC